MTNPSITPAHGRGFRLAARGLIITATAAAFVGAGSLSASAAPGDTSLASVTANVNVNSTISLALGQASFDLNGTPSSTVTKTNAVTGTVTTNNATGYSVGVVPSAATLHSTRTGNTDNIPVTALEVTDAAGNFTPMTLDPAAPVITTTKATRSGPGGDFFGDDYRVTIPDVNSDTYSVTLNYTATALA